jgi:predicted peroxiredoxin
VTKPVVYVITHDPKDRCDLVSSILAQAVTALAFGYGCEIFLMDRGSRIIVKGYLDGLKSESFEPLSLLMDNFREMEGKLYVCNPSMGALVVKKEDCIEVYGYINATKLLESAANALVVFTY